MFRFVAAMLLALLATSVALSRPRDKGRKANSDKLSAFDYCEKVWNHANPGPGTDEEHFVDMNPLQGLVEIIRPVRESGIAPATVFLFGGGPGLSGSTLAPILGPDQGVAKNFFDIAYMVPPGTNITKYLNQIPFYAIPDLYNLHTKLFWQMIKESLLPGQKAILVGHSYGGLQIADVALYNASLPEHERLPIRDMIWIAAPMSETIYKKVIPDRRKELAKTMAPDWDMHYEQYLQDYNVANYRKLVIAYAKIVFPKNERLHAKLEKMIALSPASPETFLFMQRRWERKDTLSRRLAEDLPGISKFGFYGTEDYLLPSEDVLAAYQSSGIIPYAIEGGSHFPFLDRPSPFINIFASIYARYQMFP